MRPTLRWTLFCALLGAAPLAAAACSDGTPNPTPPPQPSAETSASAAPEPSASAPEPSASAPAPEPTAEPSAAVPDKPKSSGRPPVLLADPKTITDTFGFSPAAKLELGDKEIATLRIPEGALTTATVVTFAIDTKCKTTGLVTGKVYKITPTTPPAQTPASVPTNNAAPFVMILPGAKKRDLNLAIGEFTKDAKGNDTLKWKVLGPAKVDDSGMFEFHLDSLPDGCLHLTNKPPT